MGVEALLLLKRLRASFRTADGQSAVTFVAGVQRSGTNMLMDVLEQSLSTDVYHERDPRAFERYEMRDIETIARLHASCQAPHFVIKSLCELQRLSDLKQRFPGAKIVWIVRHYNDTVNSMLISFPNFGKQIQRLARDKASDGWRGEGMSDDTQALLKRYAHPEMNEATGAALMWYLRNVLFFEQGLDQSKDLILVSYERLVSSPESEFRRIFDFVGIPYSPWHSRKVVASSIRKREPPDIEPKVQQECEHLLQAFHKLIKKPSIGSNLPDAQERRGATR
jgi:hypothetical protein